MLTQLKKSIKTAFSAVGLEVRSRRNVAACEEKRKQETWQRCWEMFSAFPIQTVLDIGAHRGEFAGMIHCVLPKAAILSFEPLKDCYQQVEALSKRLPRMKCFNVALGSSGGDAIIHRSAFTPCSSLLQMGALQSKTLPESASHTDEAIRIARLDDVVSLDSLAPDVLVKIDTQGYEKEVLLGGKNVLSRARFVVAETSCYEMYEGEPLFSEIYDLMHQLGFTYRGNIDQQISPLDRRILQVDAFFERA